MEFKAEQGWIAAVIVSLLIGAGVGIDTLNEDKLDASLEDAYVCPLTGDAYFFYGGLSGSEQRGYPTEGSRVGYKDCRQGSVREKWEQLVPYAKANGLNPYVVLSRTETRASGDVAVWGKQYRCDPDGCTAV